MTASIDLASLRERVRDALTMVRVAEFDGLTLRMEREGCGKCACPFHAEKHASFVCGGKWRDRFHCFGCGEDGDIFDFWMRRRNCDHVEAVKQLAGLAGVSVGEIHYERPKAGVERQPEKRLEADDGPAKKPSLPPLFKPTAAVCEEIAQGRGLDAEAVWIAARVYSRVAVSRWPLYQRRKSGHWMARCEVHGYGCHLDEPMCEPGVTHASWVAIDQTRNVAEFRRVDNERYERHDGSLIKTWSTAGKSWPLGAMQAADIKRVLLVEGGPDMLAGYHFLKMWKMTSQVAVVCMLGASNRIREDALEHFKGCRVRIMVDADVPKDSDTKGKRKLVGAEAALRWTNQLTEVGAAVETFYVGDLYDAQSVQAWHNGEITASEVKVEMEGYTKRDGEKVKDLNDLALCSDDVLSSDDVRQAMTVWDF